MVNPDTPALKLDVMSVFCGHSARSVTALDDLPYYNNIYLCHGELISSLSKVKPREQRSKERQCQI